MKKILVGSLNPVKIEAVRRGFQKMFPSENFECSGISVPSNVSDQPLSDEETLKGAENRVQNALKSSEIADYYVGIEGGIEVVGDHMKVFAWIVIKSQHNIGQSKTGTFFLPPQLTELVKEGKELGEAIDILFNKKNSKQQDGAIGLLTNNVIDRTTYYIEAIVLALIPFKNTDLYK